MNRSPDFNQFGGELWEIANVFRDDALHATERLETFSLFLFLKLWDEKEIEEEEELGRKKTPEEQLIPELYRFHNWALDPDGYARIRSDFNTDGNLEHMVKLFPYTFRPQLGGGVKAILKADDLGQFESKRSWWATVEEIRKNDYNLTAGRYCPHQAEAVEHEKPEVLINRLLELEEEITTDLHDLLAMVAAPSEPYTEEVAEASPLAADAEEDYIGRGHHG